MRERSLVVIHSGSGLSLQPPVARPGPNVDSTPKQSLSLSLPPWLPQKGVPWRKGWPKMTERADRGFLLTLDARLQQVWSQG